MKTECTLLNTTDSLSLKSFNLKRNKNRLAKVITDTTDFIWIGYGCGVSFERNISP